MAEPPDVFALPNALAAARRLAAELGTEARAVGVSRFANDQRQVSLPSPPASGAEVVLVQTFPDDLHGRLMELLLALDALAKRWPKRLTAVLPYLPYARSDRPVAPGAPVALRLLADLLESAGSDRIVTVALHSPQTVAAFRCPVLDLDPMPLLADACALDRAEAVVVAPDFGSAKRAESVAYRLGLPLAVMRKRRAEGRKEILDVLGDVAGRRAIFVDDEINTGETLAKAVRAARDAGATGAQALIVHGAFTAEALSLLTDRALDRIVVTDSVERPLPPCERLETVSLAPVLAEALRS